MLQDLNREVVTWLGYLQRGSVLLQLAIVVSTLLVDKRSRWTRRLDSEVFSTFAELVAPLLLMLLGAAIKALGFPGGLVQYLATLWLLWRLFKPINLLVEQRFPNLPVNELDRMLFRPLLLVFTVLSFFQILGSRESLAIIEIGDVFGVTLTVGKLFTALTITYLIVAYAKRPAALVAWLGGYYIGLKLQGQRALEVILQYSVIGVGVMGVAYYIGINGTALVAVAGGLSVGIGFGIKEIVSNFISSLWLLFEGSVRPGEILMINGDPCNVRKLGLRATQLRRGRDGAELLIPNQNFFTQEAESYTAEETSRRDAVVVGAAYHHEPKQVIAILVEVAQQHEKVLQYPPPAAFTIDFADSSINYKLLFWVRNPLEAFGVWSDLRQAIWTAFEKNGIGIPFPQRQVYPMEWPPSKEQTHRIGSPSNQLQADAGKDSAGEAP